VTELHNDQPLSGGELIPFPGQRTMPDHQSLELADQEPAIRPAEDVAAPAGTELVPADDALDAEIVTEDEGRQPTPSGLASVVWPAAVVVHQLRQHQPTVATTKFLVRQLVYLVAGVRIVTARVWDAKTNSRPERLMRAAEAAGEWDRVGEWHDRGEKMRESRHKRRMDLLEFPLKAAAAVGISIVAVHVLLLFVGFALYAHGDIDNILTPLLGLYAGIAWIAAAIAAVWGVLVTVGPFVLVAGLWGVGKKHAVPGQWTNPEPAEPGDVMDGLPDERMIVEALRHTVPALDKAIKAGWRMYYEMPPMIDGKGWRAQLALPPSAPVEEFVKRKTMLAHNLRRFPIEVWPTEPKAAVLDLWVAKPGALSGPVEPWPLLQDLDSARSDYFKGVPVGVTIKGDTINGRLFEANWVAGGMMGSGKSTLVITALLGAMLDPLVSIDVVVMADNADYDPMRPRLNRLVTGAGEESVQQCMAMLLDLFEDCSIRGQALREHDERAVTREIAEKDPRLRPRIMVIDECQNLFIGEYGKDAIETTTKVLSTARKYGITLMFLTPEPSKDALPRKLISVASNKACYAIGDHQGNDAVLGSGSYKSGISAVGLTPKTDDGPGDVGTCMQRGFTGKPGLMRGFYVPQADAHRVTQRALQLRSGRQRLLTPAPAAAKRDLLTDVKTVIGEQTVPAADIPALLSREFPNQVLYRQLTGKQLRQLLLDDYGVRVPSTDNRWPVSPKLIASALAQRPELGSAG
jgi:S-DNA-T family DNA segregation ATPase FtsK/SpoIIIE